MLKKLLLLVLCFGILILLRPNPVSAICSWRLDPLTGLNTWWKCTGEPVPKCIQDGGTIQCGTGVGCGPTGCYDCATSGTCNGNGGTPSGNNCPPGRAWDDCASVREVKNLTRIATI